MFALCRLRREKKALLRDPPAGLVCNVFFIQVFCPMQIFVWIFYTRIPTGLPNMMPKTYSWLFSLSWILQNQWHAADHILVLNILMVYLNSIETVKWGNWFTILSFKILSISLAERKYQYIYIYFVVWERGQRRCYMISFLPVLFRP